MLDKQNPQGKSEKFGSVQKSGVRYLSERIKNNKGDEIK